MEIVKKLRHQLGRWEYTGLCLLVLLTLVMQFSTIMQPNEPVFDEQYYITDARHILQGEGTARTEHPPLGKLFVTFGMFLFGDNPFGWRFFSVLFGAVCIVLFYLICRRLAMSKESSLLAAFLLSLENLCFIQASVAMLDVYSLAFMLGSFWLYLKGRYLLSGISVGLSVLAKLSGALALPVILLHWFFTNRARPRKFLSSMLLAPASFFLLMPLLNLIIWRNASWHPSFNPIEQTQTMLRISSMSTFAQYPSEMLSRPWDWILQPKILTYWVDPHYVAMISPSIWALIIPVVLYITFRAIKGNSVALFSLLWFASTYLIWIPVSLITDRISYIFYFYPTIGAICIGLALGLSQLCDIGRTGQMGRLRRVARLAIPGFLLLHLAAFIILTPVSYWWKLPACVALYILARLFLKMDKSPSLEGQYSQ
ncbi:MAG TPA: phospholipid carrier-dependent glycosyltransferase [Dehalococcoidia bacterium]|nr:phospholipid carrier-dependent glycosyltransferase [Dehalococcoidia bacterium]